MHSRATGAAHHYCNGSSIRVRVRVGVRTTGVYVKDGQPPPTQVSLVIWHYTHDFTRFYARLHNPYFLSQSCHMHGKWNGMHPPTHPLTHSPTHPLTHLVTLSPILSLSHPLTHSLTSLPGVQASSTVESNHSKVGRPQHSCR